MKTLFIEDIQDGMVLDEDVYSANSILLISKNTTINQGIINRMKQLGITFIRVKEMEASTESMMNLFHEERQQFIRTYEQSLLAVKDLMKDARFGNNIDANRMKETAENLLRSVFQNYSIIGRLNLVKNKDEYTYTHSVNVAMLATMIGKWMRLPNEDIFQLACAGLLHDIGKAKIDDAILNKPSRLTVDEYAIMQEHALEGFSLLCDIPGLSGGVIFAALSHHERYDGNGYPFGLKGEEIHLYARIIAVADIYDAMTSNRVYRKKVSPFTVAKQIADDSFGVLDPKICQVFLNNISSLYVGNRVTLSNGLVGDVVFIDPQNLDRPVVFCEHEFVDLQKLHSIEVLNIIG